MLHLSGQSFLFSLIVPITPSVWNLCACSHLSVVLIFLLQRLQEEFCNGEDIGKLHSCAHKFHFDCIKTWLNHKNRCPVCRRTGLETSNDQNVGGKAADAAVVHDEGHSEQFLTVTSKDCDCNFRFMDADNAYFFFSFNGSFYGTWIWDDIGKVIPSSNG